MKLNETKRDDKGDIITPKLSEDVWKNFRDSRWKHVFHFKDSYDNFIEVDYDKQEFENLRTDLPHFELINYKLFEHDLPVSHEWLIWRNGYDTYVNEFFQSVFKERITRGHGGIDKFELILPIDQYNQICQFITEAGLEQHKDFVFFLIAKIEEVYVHDISYSDTPEQKRRIKRFPNEVANLHAVLKRSESRAWNDGDELPPRLEEVIFKYNKGASIKITDPLLTSSVTHGTVLDFSEGIQKNWEKQLLNFPNVFDENHLHNQFRDRTCKALHNFFKHINAFDYGKHNVVDKELFAIANILNMAHIKFHNKKGEDLDIEVDLYDIKQQIKNAIKRKELNNFPSQLTAKDIQPDVNLLLKYFDEDFLKAGMQIYERDDLTRVGNVLHRFDIEELGRELLFIYDCLKQRRFQIGFQFESSLYKEAQVNSDYQSWKTVLDLIKPNSAIKRITIQKDDDETFDFSEVLSLELFKSALSDYYIKNKFEFDIDFFESTITQFSPGSFKVTPTGKLNQPQNRLLPVVIKQLYKYLLDVLPPQHNEWNPSERYFKIITALLMSIFNMGDPMFNESYIIEKVKSWYEL